MPSNTQDQTDQLVDQYIKIQQAQDQLQDKLDQLKIVIAKFAKETNQKHLKSGNTLLKVREYIKTTFPKSKEKGRKEVEEIMRNSKEWKQAITFDIVKLGTAYDKKKLSDTLITKLSPFTKKDNVIRITKSKIRPKKKV